MSSAYAAAEAYEQAQRGREYDTEVSFMLGAIERHRGEEPQELLIVGCGPGEHAKRFAEMGHDVTGVDPEPAMLEQARGKADATFHQGSLPDLPVDGTFDAVLLPYGIVNHLSEPELARALPELHALLADGGILLFDSTMKENKRELMKEFGDQQVSLTDHDDAMLTEHLEDAGFDVETSPSPIGGPEETGTAFVARR